MGDFSLRFRWLTISAFWVRLWGEKCVVNELGQGVRTVMEELPVKYEELVLGAYVIMPNHIHAIFDIKPRVTNKENHLGFLK
ncbi:MAG: hypothetical protein IJB89_04545 [Akkermansia sp.]|nr:hypothetical protein [Akkermansia sp.]